jgi:hypothetical protein
MLFVFTDLYDSNYHVLHAAMAGGNPIAFQNSDDHVIPSGAG